jgi:AcrR family transcriptional regulator
VQAPERELPPRRRTQQERRAYTEDALLDAAVRLFARRGVHETSLADIGEAAGYSRGLVNFCFGSRAALLQRLAKRVQNDLAGRFRRSATDTGDELATLASLASTYLETALQNDECTRAFFVMRGAALPSEAALRPVFAADDMVFRDHVQKLLTDGQRNKTVNSDIDPAGGAATVIGTLRGIALQYLLDTEGFDVRAAKAACAQFISLAFSP